MKLVMLEHISRTRLGALQAASNGDVARVDVGRLSTLENPVVAEA